MSEIRGSTPLNVAYAPLIQIPTGLVWGVWMKKRESHLSKANPL